jgi:molybdenum cofactor synthesis domain-containing protein
MFRKLMTLDEAKQTIDQHFKPAKMEVEHCPLLEAFNRVLSEDIISNLEIPPFARSTVDGYAVKAENTFEADENTPVKLKVTGSVIIGELPKVVVGVGEAAEIVTGAPIPEGADAVVMVEDTQMMNGELGVFAVATKNENIMKKASDIKTGEVVLKAGRVLGASEIGVLAALGNKYINVLKAPMVAVVSTGGEIVEPGKTLPPGKIYDINAYSVCTAVIESGGKPVYYGVVPDDKASLLRALQTALASSDMVITSGGVSVGPKDLTPQTVDSLGKPGVVVYGVAVKPGKPTTVAFAEGKPIVSLPGNPTSALMIYQLIVKSMVQKLAGRPVTAPKTIKATAGARMFSAKGRRTFTAVKVRVENGKYIADPVETGASGAITTLAKADGYVEVAENNQFVDAKEEVEVFLLHELPF